MINATLLREGCEQRNRGNKMKHCTMNCGASAKNPKTQAEMMKDCADCIDDDYVVTGLRKAVDTLCAMLETSQKTITSLLDKLPPDPAPMAEQEAVYFMRLKSHPTDEWVEADKKTAESKCRGGIFNMRVLYTHPSPKPPAIVACCTSLSRAEFHDTAWAIYHAKTLDDSMLAKMSIHSMRAMFDAIYDALPKTSPQPLDEEQGGSHD